MKRTLIPHVGNRYRDTAGWIVEATQIDYSGLMAVIQTVTVGQTDTWNNKTGAFFALFDNKPDQPKLVQFEKLRQIGVVQIHR